MAKKRQDVPVAFGGKKHFLIIVAVAFILLALFLLPYFEKFFALGGKAAISLSDIVARPQGPSGSPNAPSTILPSGPKTRLLLVPQLPTAPGAQALPTPLVKKLLGQGIHASSGATKFVMQKGLLRVEIELPQSLLSQLLQMEISSSDILMDGTESGTRQAVFVATENVPMLKDKPLKITILTNAVDVRIYKLSNQKSFSDFLRLGALFSAPRSVKSELTQLPADVLCADCIVYYGDRVEIIVPGGFNSGYGLEFVLVAPNVPIQGTPVLNATTLFNLTDEDIACHAREFFSPGGNQVFGVYTFEKDNQPLEVLNLAFDAQQTDAGGNTTDFSLLRHNASLGGGVQGQVPRWVGAAQSAVGGSYEFDGVDDVITVIRDSEIDFGMDDFTIEGWINPYFNLNFPVTRYSVISKGTSGPRYGLVHDVTAGSLAFILHDGTNAITVSSRAGSVPFNILTHFAVAVDRGNQATLYINGVASGNANIAALGNIANTAHLDLGRGPDSPFFGILDALLFYKRALSSAQILEHANKRYHAIADEETEPNEAWRCMVTPTDLTTLGDGNFSNPLTIAMRRANNVPTHTTPLLLGETFRNRSIEDITCLNQTTADLDNDRVVNIFNYLISGRKYTPLHLPFEGHAQAAAFALEYGSRGTRRADVKDAQFGARSGAIGGAYTFASALKSYINYSHVPELVFDQLENFTIEFLVKTTATDGVLFAKQTKSTKDLTSGESAYALRLVQGYPQFNFTDSFNGNMQTMTGLARLNDDRFRHVAVIKDKATNLIKILVDGNTEAAMPYTLGGSLGNNNADFVLGSINKSEEFFSGVIDEVRVYERALSQPEIDSHFHLNYSVVKGTETARGESWNCEVTPSDGIDAGVTRASHPLVIRNTEPMHDMPLLLSSSSLGLDSDNLTCVNQNTRDPDGDSVVNIYDFVINNALYTMLHLPFEPHEESATKVVDYSKAANGTIAGAIFRPAGGMRGAAAYELDGLDDNIAFDPRYYNISNSLSVEARFNLMSYKDNATIIAKTRLSPRDVAFALRTGDLSRRDELRDELQFLFGVDGRISIFTTTSANLLLNRFYHVVVRKSLLSQPEIFIDGVQRSGVCQLGNCGALLRPSPSAVALGQDFSSGLNTNFRGILDFVALFNRSLGTDVIRQHNLTNYSFMPAAETLPGQLWACQVTPNDGFVDGLTLQSDSLNITQVFARPLRGERLGGGGARLPNYTFDVRTQQSATYTLLPNHRVRILGVGRAEVFVLVFDRGLISQGIFESRQKKRAIFFLVPRIGTIEMFEGNSIDLDLDGRFGYDITLRVLSVEEFSVKIELRRYSFAPGGQFSPLTLPSEILQPPVHPELPSGVPPISYRAPVAEEEPGVLEKPAISYGTVGVIALLAAIIVTLIILIRKLKL